LAVEGGGIDADPHEFDFLLQEMVQLEPLFFFEVLHRAETVEHGVLHCEPKTAGLDTSNVLLHARPALPHPLHFSSHPLPAFALTLQHLVFVVVLDLRESIQHKPMKALQVALNQEGYRTLGLLSTIFGLVLGTVRKEVMLEGVES
jgi:hypothetical protein